MKKRWHFDLTGLALVWLFGGLVAAIVIASFTNHHAAPPGHRMSTATSIALIVWIAPFGIAAAVATLVGGVIVLHGSWPRRVVEPVTDDLRSVERPS